MSTEKTKWRERGQSRAWKAKRGCVLVMDVRLFTQLEETTKHLKHNIATFHDVGELLWLSCLENKIRGAGSGHNKGTVRQEGRLADRAEATPETQWMQKRPSQQGAVKMK